MPIYERHAFDPTAFMSGQMLSKVWLCEELEEVAAPDVPFTIWILGGWYATTNFLLRSRGKLPIKNVLSFDLDPEATQGAKILNETSIFLGGFNAITKDVNTLRYPSHGGSPDIVINTSCEHMEDRAWFDNIPDGTLVALQSNNMNHGDHTSDTTSLEEFVAAYPLSVYDMRGAKHFEYADWSFDRYMVIGEK
jgi:hypothetical protein